MTTEFASPTTPPNGRCAASLSAGKAWLFAGSDRGADRAAFMATLIMSAKVNDIDPQAWLADVLARIADTPSLGSSNYSRRIRGHRSPYNIRLAGLNFEV